MKNLFVLLLCMAGSLYSADFNEGPDQGNVPVPMEVDQEGALAGHRLPVAQLDDPMEDDELPPAIHHMEVEYIQGPQDPMQLN